MVVMRQPYTNPVQGGIQQPPHLPECSLHPFPLPLSSFQSSPTTTSHGSTASKFYSPPLLRLPLPSDAEALLIPRTQRNTAFIIGFRVSFIMHRFNSCKILRAPSPLPMSQLADCESGTALLNQWCEGGAGATAVALDIKGCQARVHVRKQSRCCVGWSPEERQVHEGQEDWQGQHCRRGMSATRECPLPTVCCLRLLAKVGCVDFVVAGEGCPGGGGGESMRWAVLIPT